MSLDDGGFLVKILVKISKITIFYWRELLNQFGKFSTTHASMDGVGSVLAWLAWIMWGVCVT